MPKAYEGDSVVTGLDGTVLLVSDLPKGWTPRKAATQTSPEHPGTAVVWEGEHWEVLSAETGKAGVIYRLGAWDERYAMRVRVSYDAETEARRRRTAVLDRQALRTRALILALAPLTGLAPAAVQERWERELGVPAARLTIISSAAPFALGTVSLLACLVAMFAGGRVPPFLLPFVWFFVESLIRFGVAMSQGRPLGSIPGILCYLAWERLGGGARRRKSQSVA